MTEAVLDASALLAFLRNEPGADKVRAVLPFSSISAVNLAETLGKLVERGKALDDMAFQIGRLRLDVVPFDAAQARLAATLWGPARALGLSLADRACLALALDRGAAVLTTDRAWSRLAVENLKIVLIR